VSAPKPPTSTPAYRTFAAICVAAGGLALILVTTPSYGDTGQGAGVSSSEATSQVHSETMSCKEMKAALEMTGTLRIISGRSGWGDTFYGPRVPLCQFWERPVFEYVDTTDGLCGVGYICVEKLSHG